MEGFTGELAWLFRFTVIKMKATLFRFNLNQNREASGLSKEARFKRRQRNLISMKFNIINWALETVMLLFTSILFNRCIYHT